MNPAAPVTSTTMGLLLSQPTCGLGPYGGCQGAGARGAGDDGLVDLRVLGRSHDAAQPATERRVRDQTRAGQQDRADASLAPLLELAAQRAQCLAPGVPRPGDDDGAV